MSNGAEACCALGICCPPRSSGQIASVAAILTDQGGVPQKHAHDAAVCILENFDLMPVGSTEHFKAELVKMAKHAADT